MRAVHIVGADLVAAGGALVLYAAAYAGAWMTVWNVPSNERDGLEWIFVGLLTLPWSMFVGAGGWPVVHVGAVINGVLIALLAASLVRRRWRHGVDVPPARQMETR